MNVSGDSEEFNLIRLLANRLFDDLGLKCDTQFVIAFSGGMDSTALLLAIQELSRKSGAPVVRALHFNHQIHPDADQWQQHCQQLALELEIDLQCGLWQRGTDNTGSEAEARQARYHWFGQQLQKDEVLLTAHHQDDQVETLLLSLFQGRNLARIAGMSPIRAIAYGDPRPLCRPLLGVTKAELRDYLESSELPAARTWIDDPANLNPQHDRNYLRHQVLPILRQRWPQLDQGVARTASRLARVNQQRESSVTNLLERCIRPEQRRHFCCASPLELKALIATDAELRVDLLRRWIHRGGIGAPGDRQLATLATALADPALESRYRLDWNNHSIRGFNGLLYLLSSLPEVSGGMQCQFGSGELLPGLGFELIPCGNGLARSLFDSNELSWCWRRGGEQVTLPGRKHRSAVKKLLQQHAVPPWERERLPYLKWRDEIVWMAGPGLTTDLSELLAVDGWIPEFFCTKHSDMSG